MTAVPSAIGPTVAGTELSGRPLRRSVDELLAEARSRIDRVEPAELEDELRAGALVVDTRTWEQRHRDGEMPGAVVIDRTVFEWRLDPASDWRIAETDYDRRIIVVCHEGYSSSLAAASLVDLGIHRAADLTGGFEAWAAHVGSGGPATPNPR